MWVSAQSSSFTPPNLTHIMGGLGFKSVNPFGLLNHITSSFATFIQTIFAWVFFLSELAVLMGAIVFVGGAIAHQSRWKQTGTRMVLYAILGFFVAVLAPGAIMAISSNFHG